MSEPQVLGGWVLPNPEPWAALASCASVGGDTWYPEKGGSTKGAKSVCISCPVREACLQSALDRDERFGIWGGYSERERRRLKRGEHVRLFTPERPREPAVRHRICEHCGTGFDGHPQALYCGADCKNAAAALRHNENRRNGRYRKNAA